MPKDDCSGVGGHVKYMDVLLYILPAYTHILVKIGDVSYSNPYVCPFFKQLRMLGVA
jgi:hypothetical protein